jgi:hypothetical protein
MAVPATGRRLRRMPSLSMVAETGAELITPAHQGETLRNGDGICMEVVDATPG